jgi:alpha-L-fucosidase
VKRQPFTGEDFRFTTKGDTLYAIALAWPRPAEPGARGKLVVKSLADGTHPVKNVVLLGYDGELSWTQSDKGLVVELPAKPPCDFAVALKIDFSPSGYNDQ